LEEELGGGGNESTHVFLGSPWTLIPLVYLHAYLASLPLSSLFLHSLKLLTSGLPNHQISTSHGPQWPERHPSQPPTTISTSLMAFNDQIGENKYKKNTLFSFFLLNQPACQHLIDRRRCLCDSKAEYRPVGLSMINYLHGFLENCRSFQLGFFYNVIIIFIYDIQCLHYAYVDVSFLFSTG